MKSQMSIEFLTGVVILLIIYIATISIFSNYLQTNIIPAEKGKQVCYSITNNVNSALIGGDGFTVNASMPNNINGEGYLVFVSPIDSSLLTVDWGDSQFACSMNTQDISVIFFRPCCFSVNNIGGDIIISTVSSDKSEYKIGEVVEIYGGVYLTDVNLLIYDADENILENQTLGLEIMVLGNIEAEGSFTYEWEAEQAGEIRITATDAEYKNLYSERIIYVS